MKHKSSIFNKIAASILSKVAASYAKHEILKGFGSVSATQKIALDAGTADHEKEFFTGIPNWEALDDLPLPAVSEKAQELLDVNAKELAELVDDWEIRNSDRQDLTPEAWDYLKRHKFLGLVIPKHEGGLGLSAYDHAEIVARIGTHSLSAALTTMVPNSLGPGELLERYGMDEQKKEYLPKLADGTYVPFFALTEPFAGSDAFGIRTSGEVFRDPETHEVKIRINGEKRYITLSGEVGTLGGFAIQLKDPENLLGKGEEPGITCVLIKRGTDGLNIGNRHRPLDVPFQNGPIFLDDVEISADDIIGGPNMAGQGALMLMECLGIGRSISLPANSASTGFRTAFAVGAYTAIRKQFGFSIADMKGQHGSLAEIAGLTYMVQAARTAMALRVDKGERPSIGSAILKVQATEAMARIVEAGMRLQGGNAIMQGPRNLMGMLPQGEYIARTVEGDNNMQRSVVIFGQGFKKGHAFLSKEIEAAEQGDNKKFGQVFRDHLQDILDNKDAARRMGKTGRGGDVPAFATDDTSDLFRQINRMSAAFNLAANVAGSSLGGAIQFEQPTSTRLGVAYGNLLMSYYTLWHFHKVQKSDPEFLPIVKWAVQHKLHEAEEALDDLITNFPLDEGLKAKVAGIKAGFSNDTIKNFMRSNIFPQGRKHGKPSDALETEVASKITQAGAVRDWIESNMLIPDDDNNIIRHIDNAFKFITEQEEPVLEKLAAGMDHRAFKKLTAQNADDFLAAVEKLGVLTVEEVDVLKKAEQYRKEVVEVDYYNPANMRTGQVANPFKGTPLAPATKPV